MTFEETLQFEATLQIAYWVFFLSGIAVTLIVIGVWEIAQTRRQLNSRN